MKIVVIIVLVVATLYTGVQVMNVYKTRSDLEDKIERELSLVEQPGSTDVVQRVTQDAQALGVKLKPQDVHVTLEDTDVTSLAQQMVGGKLGAQFQNKHAEITVVYTAYVDGFAWRQNVSRGKITQVAAQIPVRKETQELLDSH